MAILLGACASQGMQGATPENRAERLANRGNHAESASAYIGMAANETDMERDRLTLLAVEQWLEAGDGRRARNALRQVDKPAAGELLWLWSIDASALSLWEGHPDAALRMLDPLSKQALPMDYRLRVEALLADAWFQKDDPIRALELYRQREEWLNTSGDIANNRQRMWAGLLVSHPYTLRTAAAAATDEEIEGWLTLGALAASTGRQGIGWANGVMQWREQHDGHPAMRLLESMDLPEPGQLEYPRQIALLLPMSGSNSSAGKAVQNGFFGAFFASTEQLGDAQQVTVYDTSLAGGAARAYADAVEDGVQFVVGPLLREEVAAVIGAGLLPVPMLALNNLPDDQSAPPGVYQFALSPEDEAVSAAQRAIAEGKQRALALVPNSDWGRRLLDSFANEFEGAGGTLLEAQDYQGDKQDFSFELENLLLLSDSVQRYRRLRANIGGTLQFDPRRRQDADFIFLAATAGAGRLLKSQLKFHYAGDLPVYSTSRIFAMDGRSNSDLNGLLFADTPWIVNPQPWIAELPGLYAQYWPEERHLGRLHALGYDAYHLVSALFGTRRDAMQEIDGATGTLYLGDDGRIHRRLAWAQFRKGEPVASPLNADEFDYAPDEEEFRQVSPEGDISGFEPTSGT